MGDDGQYQWLHPATVLQAWMEGLTHNNYFLNSYILTLCSTAPLQDDQVGQALTHLARKVPTLRLCFRRCDGRPWACFRAREDIDFQVVEGKTADEVTEYLGTHQYNVTEGPLWCARLLKNEEDVKPSRTELEADFPYVRTLALGNHHGMSDGTTNVETINLFMQILNYVIAGKDIDDSKQMGEYNVKAMQEIHNAQDKKLEKDPENLKLLLKGFKEEVLDQPLMCRALPPIHNVPFKTKFIQTYFDKETTSKFIKKCKEAGVTVNSGFTSLLNVTLVDYMKEVGLMQDEYPIKVAHAVNMRRFLPKNLCDILGVNISLLVEKVKTPANWQESFWDYVKEVHRAFYKDLEENTVSYLCLVRRTYYDDDAFISAYSTPHAPEFDQVNAPIGNLDIRIPTEGDHVRIGHVVRFAANALDPIMQMYHSFRGRFYYSLSYSVNLMSTDTAQRLVDLLVKNFKSQV